MRMALQDGQIIIKEADTNQYNIIKSWGKMRWDRSTQALYGPADADLLNKLAQLVRLPASIESERKHLNDIAAAVDLERMDPDPEPLYKYPVKQELYKHQIRGANMALLVFGLIDPPEGDK